MIGQSLDGEALCEHKIVQALNIIIENMLCSGSLYHTATLNNAGSLLFGLMLIWIVSLACYIVISASSIVPYSFCSWQFFKSGIPGQSYSSILYSEVGMFIQSFLIFNALNCYFKLQWNQNQFSISSCGSGEYIILQIRKLALRALLCYFLCLPAESGILML